MKERMSPQRKMVLAFLVCIILGGSAAVHHNCQSSSDFDDATLTPRDLPGFRISLPDGQAGGFPDGYGGGSVLIALPDDHKGMLTVGWKTGSAATAEQMTELVRDMFQGKKKEQWTATVAGYPTVSVFFTAKAPILMTAFACGDRGFFIQTVLEDDGKTSQRGLHERMLKSFECFKE